MKEQHLVTLKLVSQCKVIELGADGVPGEILRVEDLSELNQKPCCQWFPHCLVLTPGKYPSCCFPNISLHCLPKDYVGVGVERG